MIQTCQECEKEFEDGRQPGQRRSRARFCGPCQVLRQGLGRTRPNPRKKYFWTEALDDYLREHCHGGLKARHEVLNQLVRMTGFPREFIKKQAQRLGLCLHNPDRRAWTAPEMEVLERFTGKISSLAIAKRLHRPESSVVLKLRRMNISRRVRNGYTMGDLQLCLGVDHHKVRRWIDSGWLRDRPQGTKRHDGNGDDIHRFRERDLVKFIAAHPNEINLGKVDQLWFLDLVLMKGREASNGNERLITENNGQ
jgi:hypothetical protein